MKPQTDQQNLGFLLHKAAHLLRRSLSERLEEHGITAAQWGVLRDLAVQEKLPAESRGCTPGQIAARLEQDRPTMTGILERLQKKGLIRVDANPRDRRSQLVVLSREAAALIPALDHESRLVLEQGLGSLEPAERQQLRLLLCRFIGSLEEEGCHLQSESCRL